MITTANQLGEQGPCALNPESLSILNMQNYFLS